MPAKKGRAVGIGYYHSLPELAPIRAASPEIE